MSEDEATSDYKQWLHAMKLVAHLPGGMPPEFRRKLWLSLADKYLKSKNIDWAKEEEKCFCEKWREDDEELGIQIVKDLHRTGSNLCTGPTGTINQAKLKRILLGYARYNPEVGYCQGFNMLGALILQVMDKNEFESIKVMIYLVEGVLPPGYFHGSMVGLQADMGVFRELMHTKLPRLAKHLQKLQGPIENAYEPPLTNVFTMQWFLTLFCTCLPMTCVLRVWDLVLIEGSDVLLRTALVLWSLLEDRVLSARTADEFYCKMGSFSGELLNGHLIDSNGLIEKVVKLGSIPDIQKLRDKHLYNIAPLRNKPGLQLNYINLLLVERNSFLYEFSLSFRLYYDEGEGEGESDEDSRLAVATVWGVSWGRRGSADKQMPKQPIENKERIALDISLLKKQYDRLRERQKQAQLILTTACNTARQTANPVLSNTNSIPVNQLLMGRQAIVTNRGKRISSPAALIPPARKPSLPAVLQVTKQGEKQLRRGETLHWRDTDLTKEKRRDSLTWKEIRADRQSVLKEVTAAKYSQKIGSRLGKSDSSSYSDESDDDSSSTDTSLCDDEEQKSTEDRTLSSTDDSPKHRAKTPRRKKALLATINQAHQLEKERPKSWAPTSHEIPFLLMPTESPAHSGDEKLDETKDVINLVEDKPAKNKSFDETDWTEFKSSDLLTFDKPTLAENELLQTLEKEDTADKLTKFKVNNNGVTNQYFERVNSIERPKKLDLFYSLNEEDSIRNAFADINIISKHATSEPNVPCQIDFIENSRLSPLSRTKVDLDIKEVTAGLPKLEAPHFDDKILNRQIRRADSKENDINKGEDSGVFSSCQELEDVSSKKISLHERLKNKRRDPRRMTLTRSSTIDIEERFKNLEKNDVLKTYESTDMREIRKPIPSTADLEERYNILERQLNGNSKNRSIEIAEDVQFRSTYHNQVIPTTLADQEHFTSLSKQMSSNDTPTSNFKENNAIETNKNDSNSKKKENLDKKTSSEEKEKVETTLSENQLEETQDVENKPRLKKLPSTAELEDRFNALERRLSAQKSSPLKAKKEPPDGSETTEDLTEMPHSEKSIHDVENNEEKLLCTEKDKNEILKTELKLTDKHETAKNYKKEEQHEQNKTVDTHSKESDPCNKESDETPPKEHTKKQEQSELKDIDDSNDRSPTTEEVQQILEAKHAEHESPKRRKSPPTTEELETRYRAIEKQLSVNQSENEDSENVTERTKTKQSVNKDTSSTTQNSCKANEEKKHSKPKLESKTNNESIKNMAKQIDSSKSQDKRRGSEPPSTEDLEKRYENLKRRMSSRTDVDKTLTRAEVLAKQAHRAKDQCDGKEIEVVKAREEKKANDIIQNTDKKQLPTTADLESRFEELQLHNSSKTPPNGSPVTANTENSTKTKRPKKIIKSKTEVVDNDDVFEIPTAPPLPLSENAVALNLIIPSDSRRSLQRALVEELQRKIKTSPDGTNLKPSLINPLRKSPAIIKSNNTIDVTSETHAKSAFSWSENHELWQQKKSVRRFSDLPSRADLENRLEFLERQLYQKFTKQRCASDSEVTSMKNISLPPQNHIQEQELPSTSMSHTAGASCNLEERVQALEKQLSENSLKLLEAVRQITNDQSSSSLNFTQHMTDKTVDSTGKELVRYSQSSEVEDADPLKPLNINIHIKMSLNKKDIPEEEKTSERLPTTEELEKRLEILEKQIRESKLRQAFEQEKKLEQYEKEEKDLIKESKECIDKQAENVEKLKECAEKKEENVENLKESVEKKEENVEKLKECVEKKAENVVKQIESVEKQKESVEKQKESVECPKDVENEITIDEEFEENLIKKVDKELVKETEKPVKTPTTIQEACVKKNENNENDSQKNNEIREVNEVKKNAEQNPPDIKEKTPPPSENKESAISVTNGKNEQKEKEHDHAAKKNSEMEARSEEPQSLNGDKEKLCRTTVPPLQNKQTEQEMIEVVPTISSTQEEAETITKTNSTEKSETNKEIVVDVSEIGNVDSSKKTLVLLMDNEPKAVKVRRLTRANTEELEGLFEALEKQLNERNLVKSDDGKLVHASAMHEKLRSESKKINELTKEIEKLTNTEHDSDTKIERELEQSKKDEQIVDKAQKEEIEPYDWGPDPAKRHLKRKTAYLPSTKELEARFRSFERQIKFLEDVEKIDVEQRLNEIERKIKLQYSLSHEKDLNKFLDLCEGKDIDTPEIIDACKKNKNERSRSPTPTRSRQQTRTPHASPSRNRKRTPSNSPGRNRVYESPYTSPVRSNRQSPYISPTCSKHGSPYTSPQRCQHHDANHIPSTEDLEYRFRALELKRSKSKENLDRSRKDLALKKQPIHPLEMLLDPSPDESNIPTTGELEHRMRMLEEKRKTPTSPKSSRSKSPKKAIIYSPETSPMNHRELPTADELEARVRALEEEQRFDFKMQKTYKEFNQKLKDAISPSLSFEEFQAAKSREQSPKRIVKQKSTFHEADYSSKPTNQPLRSTSPKVIRFAEEMDEFEDESKLDMHSSNFGKTVGKSDDVIEMIEENSKILHRILKKTFTDSNSSIYSTLAAAEGLEARGARLLRETSPMRRTGTHTGTPLRTDININDRLDSIKNSIKSIDSLCEEKPYRKEKCQRYIDSLFSDSVHFSNKKSSLEDLRRRDYGPSIRVSDVSERPSDRTIGSAESIRSTSPLRAASPLHHRSNRELRREISPRRRRDEDREELESRVRRENMLPKSFFLDNSNVSRDNSLTQFYKVDRQLEQYKFDERNLSNSQSTLRSPFGSMEMMHKKTAISTTPTNTTTQYPKMSSHLDFDKPQATYRPSSNNLSGYDSYKRSNNAPIYNPGKLEIRHTTVTSTFYDRLLTEKQIEKNLTRTPSRSPLVSPSVTSKSYTDLQAAACLTSSNIKSPSIEAKQVTPTANIISANISLAPHLPFSYTNPNTMTTRTLITCTTSNTTTQSNTSNIDSSLNPNLTTNAIVSSCYTYSPLPVLNNFTTSNTTPITNSGLNSQSSLATTAISTGVYNPVMPFIMRQPQDPGTITSLNVLEQNKATVNGNLAKL